MSANYKKMSRPPETALRKIEAGDLKGKTDINPQWRYEIMDEVYGPCGDGWKYEIVKLWDYPTQDGTVLAFAQINVYVKTADGWSDPIPGLGGNTLVDMVKGYNQGDPKRPKPNDEGYKMAITDALGTALKMLGVAADIYAGRWDGSKYRDDPPPPVSNNELVNVKSALIDWLQVQPPIFTDAQRKYAEDAIAKNNLHEMKIALAKAVEKSKKEKAHE
jgi:hypothetical protein